MTTETVPLTHRLSAVYIPRVQCSGCGAWTGPRPARRCPTCTQVCEPVDGVVRYPDGHSYELPDGWCRGECSTECDFWSDGKPCGCRHHWFSCECEGADGTDGGEDR
jgi:hypothetical protein